MKYCLEDVDTGELLDYVDEIKEETKTATRENEELRQQIEKVSSQMQNMENIVKQQAAIISPLQAKLGSDGRPRDGDSLSLKKEILSLKKEDENRIHQSFERFLAVVLGKEGPGILALLGHKQETPFNRLFVASQSSADVCSLLVPHADDRFGTSNKGCFRVGFTLGRAVTISDVKVFSAGSDFPKCFDISVEGETVVSVAEANKWQH